MADYVYYNGELYHVDRKKHKYIAKVPIGKGKYRYFYDKEEYRAYMNNKTENKSENKKSKTNSVSNFFNKIFNKLNNLFKKSKKQVSKTINKGKKFVEEVILGLNTDRKTPGTIFKYIERVKMSNGKYRYFYDEDEYKRYMNSRKYLEKEPEFMKKIPKISEEESFAVKDIMAKINPGYSRYDKSTSRNCANCTAAYELRCRGYDVKAATYKNIGEYLLNGVQYRFSYYYKNANCIMLDDEGKEHKSILNGTRYQKDFEYSSRTVEAAIVKHSGKNTRGDISVEWKQGSAHSMVYEVDSKGNVLIRDCQTNRVHRVSEITGRVKNIIITRTDNLELKKSILDAVEDN